MPAERPRTNQLRIFVLMDDPHKGRAMVEVLGQVTTTQCWDLDGRPEPSEVKVTGQIVRAAAWDGTSPMPEPQREVEQPALQITESP